MQLRSVLCPALLGLALVSCDKSTQPTTPPPDEAAVGDDGAGATETEAQGDVPWAQMTFDQRKSYMGKHVFPKMKASFSSHDAALFKGFKCETCHGDDKTYKMPNEGIYPLSGSDPLTAAMEYDEKVTRFMIDEVVPQMAELLGTVPWSPENQDGLGCFACHPSE
jgi:hypothetical protein